MTQKQKLKMAKSRVEQIYAQLKSEYPNLILFGETIEEIEIRLEVHACIWLAGFDQTSGNYKEADHMLKTMILMNSAMIQAGVLDKKGEVVRKH
jgi:hypothetical protein